MEPCTANNLAMLEPMPAAAPVTMDTFSRRSMRVGQGIARTGGGEPSHLVDANRARIRQTVAGWINVLEIVMIEPPVRICER